MRDNTIVIYTSDHGFSLGHHGIWGHGAATWPSTTHRASFNIPLIFAGGPIESRNDPCDEMISQIDLFPTLASLAGISMKPSLPSNAGDFKNYLVGDQQNWRDAVFMEQEETRSIRTREWLYMMRFGAAPGYPLKDELYHLTNDPLEKFDLIESSELDEVKNGLRQRVISFFEAHAEPEFDLWNGGTAKSNVTFPALWKDAWGSEWKTQFG